MTMLQRFREYLRYIWSNKNYRLSFYLGGLVLAWLLSGLVVSSDAKKEETTAPKPIEESKVLVQARFVDSESYQPKVHVRARTEANRLVSLRSELSGRIVALSAEEGSQVGKGDVVCELALEDRQLRYQEANSAVAQAQLEYDGSLRLKSGGYQSDTAIAAAKARLDSAKAALLRSKIDLENTKIRAPFDGIIDRHSVEIGDFMDRGDECAVLVDLDPLIIRGQVSELEVGRLHRGIQAYAQLLTGQQVTGKVSLVGLEADAVTRTFPLEVKIPNAELKLRSGITAELVIPSEPVQAHQIASSLLSLDDDGRVGVRVLSDQHRVKFINVNLIGDGDRGVWVTGLPERTLLITVGQEYVSPGELVDVVIEENTREASGLATHASKAVPVNAGADSHEEQTAGTSGL